MSDGRTNVLPIWGKIGPRGVRHCIGDDGAEWLWANCHYAGCSNAVCHRLSPIWCWPHLDGAPTGTEFIESMQTEKVS